MKGRVALWNNSTNCGFIEVDDEELFVHIKEQNIHIYEDEIIEFSIEKKSKWYIYIRLEESYINIPFSFAFSLYT